MLDSYPGWIHCSGEIELIPNPWTTIQLPVSLPGPAECGGEVEYHSTKKICRSLASEMNQSSSVPDPWSYFAASSMPYCLQYRGWHVREEEEDEEEKRAREQYLDTIDWLAGTSSAAAAGVAAVEHSLKGASESFRAGKRKRITGDTVMGSSQEPQSIAAKNRREKISQRLRILQDLVPNGSKVDIVTMLEKAISYVKFLQLQVKILATDEFWPSYGRNGQEISRVKDAMNAIIAFQGSC